MSHYTIDYAALEGDAKRAQAIQDIKNYLGEKCFAELDAELRAAHADVENGGLTLESMRFHLMFIGVRGYPVTAWYETLTQAT